MAEYKLLDTVTVLDDSKIVGKVVGISEVLDTENLYLVEKARPNYDGVHERAWFPKSMLARY